VPDAGLTDTPAPPSPIADPSPTVKPSPPPGRIHIVRTGDTLWQIAAWHRTDLQLIRRWNGDTDPRRLVAGRRILVPGGRPMPKPRPAPVAERASVAERAPAPRPPVQSRRHVWPLPVRGTITTRFSAAHPGIDIANRAGTPVRAIAGGTVTWAGWKTNGGGYVVVIRHPDGMISTYNHNRRVLVRRGQVVSAGQRVAEVGASGWATGPHLDLRIRMGGRLVNPLGLAWAR
jgi:murein DD-endopeptidase MepM/ murein hydrolase activator NlpD